MIELKPVGTTYEWGYRVFWTDGTVLDIPTGGAEELARFLASEPSPHGYRRVLIRRSVTISDWEERYPQ